MLIRIVVIYVPTRYGQYSPTYLLRDIKHSPTHLLTDIKYSLSHLPLTSTTKYEPFHLGLKLQVRCLLFCSLNRSNYSTISVPHKHHPVHSSHIDGSYVSVFRHTTLLNTHVNIHRNTIPHHRNLIHGVNKCNVRICDKLEQPAVATLTCALTVD
jgi:hypothetical protein